MNSVIFILMLLLITFSIYFVYTLFDKEKLYLLLVFMIIISILLSFKTFKLFSLNINANIISYMAIFTIITILIDKNRKKDISKIYNITMYSLLLGIILLLISCFYLQSINGFIGINMKNLYLYNYQIFIFFPITLLLSEYILINLYKYLQKIYKNQFINSLFTCIVTYLVYMIVFSFIGYITKLSVVDLFIYSTSNYLCMIVISILNSFFLYKLVNSKKVKL